MLDTLESQNNVEGDYDQDELVKDVRVIEDTLAEPERELAELHDLRGGRIIYGRPRLWARAICVSV